MLGWPRRAKAGSSDTGLRRGAAGQPTPSAVLGTGSPALPWSPEGPRPTARPETGGPHPPPRPPRRPRPPSPRRAPPPLPAPPAREAWTYSAAVVAAEKGCGLSQQRAAAQLRHGRGASAQPTQTPEAAQCTAQPWAHARGAQTKAQDSCALILRQHGAPIASTARVRREAAAWIARGTARGVTAGARQEDSWRGSWEGNAAVQECPRDSSCDVGHSPTQVLASHCGCAPLQMCSCGVCGDGQKNPDRKMHVRRICFQVRLQNACIIKNILRCDHAIE